MIRFKRTFLSRPGQKIFMKQHGIAEKSWPYYMYFPNLTSMDHIVCVVFRHDSWWETDYNRDPTLCQYFDFYDSERTYFGWNSGPPGILDGCTALIDLLLVDSPYCSPYLDRKRHWDRQCELHPYPSLYSALSNRKSLQQGRHEVVSGYLIKS